MQTQDSTPIYSDFRDDPDMAELIGDFVAGLSERVAKLRSLVDSGDLAGIRTMAHQLKGASGGYGFDIIGQAAARLEAACKATDEVARVRDEVQELIRLCQRARSTPADPAGSACGS